MNLIEARLVLMNMKKDEGIPKENCPTNFINIVDENTVNIRMETEPGKMDGCPKKDLIQFASILQ